jgi:snapalysin
MLIRRVARLLIPVVAMSALLMAVPLTASAAAAEPAPPTTLVRTLYYDTSRAQEFAADWEAGARVWNQSVSNVQLVKVSPGGRANITILADDGWPRAQRTSLGNGTVWMGRTAVEDGYYVVRITAHELGHILGLPDRRTGLCSDLMSGSSAPVSCGNAYPSAAEAAAVQSYFAGSALVGPADVRDSWVASFVF